MSAYGHELERGFPSAHSLPSRGSSEMGSHYSTEAGIFMSSITAMVFIICLVTVAVSLISLLVALTVMLQSCEARNSEVIESYGLKSGYDYCRNFALHAELNSLGEESLPEICRDVDILYVQKGQYRRDLNITVGIIEDFFNSFTTLDDDSRGIVMMDADDLTYKLVHSSDADYLKHVFVKKLYLKLQRGGSQFILFSRKPEKLRNSTVEYLASVGCHGWSSLIMRKENDMHVDFEDFLSRQRAVLQKGGLRITAVISSRMDALRGPCLGDRVFKLPNPMFRYTRNDLVKSEINQSKEIWLRPSFLFSRMPR